ncbi:hypothetical protein C5S29_09525 [ANME-1 cluster archaeon GoMg3.2]|nr:hypothetical protein [ANME-1 cluster archaeon GoMg3.2]
MVVIGRMLFENAKYFYTKEIMRLYNYGIK